MSVFCNFGDPRWRLVPQQHLRVLLDKFLAEALFKEQEGDFHAADKLWMVVRYFDRELVSRGREDGS